MVVIDCLEANKPITHERLAIGNRLCIGQLAAVAACLK